MFLIVCAVGIVGWGVGTGAMPLPGKLGRLLGKNFGTMREGEEGEWEDDEDDEDDEDEVVLE